MLTADHHPCQALADLMTLQERFGTLEGLKLAYVGDGNNVAHSLMISAPKAGVEVVVATPAELAPQPVGDGVGWARTPAEAAVEAAHAVYTDVWVSMGDEDGDAKRELLAPYRLDEALLGAAPRRRDRAALPAGPPGRGDHARASSTASARRSGTRRRTACTRRRHCLELLVSG